MEQRLPPKRQVAELLLSEAASMFIHLDPRREHVIVPTQFQKQPHLILEVGLNMAVPILDLAVDDDGITCTLSFSRRPFWCRMPWASIFALVSSDQRGMVWPDDVPREVAFKFGRPADGGPGPGAAPKEETRRGPRLVSAEPNAGEGKEPEAAQVMPDEPTTGQKLRPAEVTAPAEKADESEAAAESKRKLPPYLRVVK